MFVTKQLMDPIDFHIMGGKKSMAITVNWFFKISS